MGTFGLFLFRPNIFIIHQTSFYLPPLHHSIWIVNSLQSFTWVFEVCSESDAVYLNMRSIYFKPNCAQTQTYCFHNIYGPIRLTPPAMSHKSIKTCLVVKTFLFVKYYVCIESDDGALFFSLSRKLLRLAPATTIIVYKFIHISQKHFILLVAINVRSVTDRTKTRQMIFK